MTELATIARPYAKAIFEVAKVNDLLTWCDLISEMAHAVKNHNINILIKNVALTHQQIVSIFTSILNTPLNTEAKNFINILVENNRLEILPEIATQFYALKNLHEGTINVTIISAFKLSNIQLKDITLKLNKKFNLKINLILEIDNKLIGGLRIVVDDQVFDISIRKELQKLYSSLIT